MNRKRFLGLMVAMSLGGALLTGCGTDNLNTNIISQANSAITEFVLVPNGGATSVSVKNLNLSNGSVAQVLNQATGLTPVFVKTHPSQRFVYVANRTDDTISVFTVSAAGGLTQVAGSPFATATGVSSLGIAPNGQFLYAAGTNQVSSFTIGANGALAGRTDTNLVSGSATVCPQVFYTAPNGTLNLVIGAGSGAGAALNVFPVNQNGSLGAGTMVLDAAASSIDGLSLHPGGLLVASVETPGANNARLRSYTLANAGPQQAGETVLPFDCGGVSSNRNGFIYVGSDSSNQLGGFTVSQAGVFSALNGSPFALTHLANFVAVDPTSNFVLAVDNGNTRASVLGIGNGGALTVGNGSPFNANLTAPFLPDFVQFAQ